MKQGGAIKPKSDEQNHDTSLDMAARAEKPQPKKPALSPEANPSQAQFGNAAVARNLEQQPPTARHAAFGGDLEPDISQLQQGLGNAAVVRFAAANALPMQQQTTAPRQPQTATGEAETGTETTGDKRAAPPPQTKTETRQAETNAETAVGEEKPETENNTPSKLKVVSPGEKKKQATPEANKTEAKKQKDEADKEEQKATEAMKTLAAGKSGTQQAGAGGGVPMDSAGGGAPPIPAVGGGDPQGGSEDDGADELEARLASADPERASADEADPVDIVTGDSDAEEESALVDVAEPPMPISKPVASTPVPSLTDTSADSELSTPTGMPDMGAAESAATEAEGDFAPAAIDEPDSAGGFAGDEPALGGGAADAFGSADLSEPEKQAALESIGEPAAAAGDVGGGGGGGSAIAKIPPAKVPDVAGESPQGALAKVSALPPVQLAQALGGVKGAVANDAGEARGELTANPPQMERPTGSPKNLHQQAAKPEPGSKPEAGRKVEKAPEGTDQPTPQPEPLPTLPPSPADQFVQPDVQAGESGELSTQDTARLSGSLNNLPTRDPGLHASAGPTPRVALSGNADPAQSDAQRQELQAGVNSAQAQGQKDVVQEMGENTQIYPSVTPETLSAKITTSTGAGAAKGESAAIGSADPESLSILAQKEKGGEIQAALTKAQGDMTAQKAEYADKVESEKADSAKNIQALETQSATDQAQARSAAQAEVKAKKGEWGKEQETLVQNAEKDADSEITRGRADIQKEKQAADDKAAKEVESGNREAEREREKAEQKAQQEKNKGEKESSGFFGWLASKATAFFNKIKAAVTAVFDLARKLIKKAIEYAKKAAMWAIEQARKAIVAVIEAVGKALIAIGDRLLAAFPKLRDKFRKFIQEKVDKAVATVNEYAEKLKKGVSALLDLLAAGLDKLIGWLEKGMLAVVDAYAAVVTGALKFAEKVAQALGAFFVLVKDIAANPVQWVANLAAGVVGGIKNHLWKAFKEAVKEWFNSKLEQVLGLGQMVWGLIKSGGLALATVGKMAWEGIKAMIPPTLIRILVEKLAAMIVPAVGAIMVIVEALQAAWGTVQRIIAAFQKFFAFLKAVKSGNAGLPFAQALAAAAVAVIDFVANWLILKLAKGAAKIGGKIKGLAKKILGRKKGRTKGRKAKKPKKGKPAKARKKKAPAKKGKKSAKDKKRDRKDKKKKDQEKRIARALRMAKARLRSPIPAKKARKTISRIARQNRVKYKFKDQGKRWYLKFFINPMGSQWFKEDEDRKKVSKLLRQANINNNKFYDYLEDLARLKAPEPSEDMSERKRIQQGRAAVKQDIEAAGGIEEFINQRQSALPARERGGATLGEQFQEDATAAFRRQAEAAGKIVVSERDVGEKGGLDVTIIDPETGEVEVIEVKRGQPRATTQRSSSKPLPAGTESIPLDAGTGEVGEGSKGTRHLARHPEHAERLVDPENRAVLTEGDRYFENQLSAITTNLMSNLEKVADYLRTAYENEPVKEVRAKLRKAEQAVRRILNESEARLTRSIAQRQSAGKPHAKELQAIQLLLNASARQLSNVNIRDIFRDLGDQGELIES